MRGVKEIELDLGGREKPSTHRLRGETKEGNDKLL